MQEGPGPWRLLVAVCAACCLLAAPAPAAAHWRPPVGPGGVEPVALVLRGDALSTQSLRLGAKVLADQFNGQVRHFWGGPRIQVHLMPAHVPRDWPLIELVSSGRPQAAGGFHAIGVGGRPFAVVYLRSWAGDWTVGASHELLEMLEDPAGDTIANQYLEEICDPVQFVWYRLKGFYVSDFVTPAWFSGTAAPWDAAGRLRAVRTFARGGEEDYHGSGSWHWIGPGAHMHKAPKPLKLRRL